VPEYSPLAFIDVELLVPGRDQWVASRALLDPGGQGSFINYTLCHSYPQISKSMPLGLTLADGKPSSSGSVTHHTPLMMKIAGHAEPIGLDISSLAHDIILGMPWFRKHNPNIDWTNFTLSFHSPYCLQNCAHYGRTIPLHTSASQIPSLQSPTQTPSPTPPEIKVSFIGAGGLNHLLEKEPETKLFLLAIDEILHPSASSPTKQHIPLEYQKFTDTVFSKTEADKLPPHRPYDHRIPLEPNQTPPFANRIYPLSPKELEALRTYLSENLEKGFIRPSHSPCSAPILFVRKADGTLRLCVDYRALNKITIKTRYPLPLITELFDRLRNAKYFTKFDVRDGYNRLRVAPGEEWKTAFKCRYGQYEYTVMPFGLCNAPGTFQHYMNDTFQDYVDRFLIIYLDDLLVYSSTLAEHKEHVALVLKRLETAGLYLKPSKCVFHATEVPFLGFIVGRGGLRMDPTKIEPITNWPRPESPRDIQVFMGLAGFYRRFIRNFSRIAQPLTALLRKNKPFRWTSTVESAFKELCSSFTSAPVLSFFDPELPVVLETDSSDYALGAIISQRDFEGILHPIAFHSRRLLPAEEHYEIHDKEMLAIVDTMDKYRHYFEGLGPQTTIYADHRNLLSFTEKRLYNSRQIRWMEKLSRFNFIIVFRPGKTNGKADALSRRPDFRKEAEQGPKEHTVFLKPHQIDLTALTVVVPIGNSLSFAEKINKALQEDDEISTYLPYLKDPLLPRDSRTSDYLRMFTLEEDDILRHSGRVYIPRSDTLKLDILRQYHDSPTAGHLGQSKTFDLVARHYYWPHMRRFINDYVSTCDTCARNKLPKHSQFGHLHPLPIPTRAWQSVSMDFIVELPPSAGYDAIYVCVDRLTKMAHFIPTTSNVTAQETANLYLSGVYRHHGLPEDIVSDRGPQFTSKFARELLRLLQIQGNRSTAYHPQSDGQTERVNQILEQYVRIFCHYQQDDWVDLLPLAEFSYNNARSATTHASPFYANYGYNPRPQPHTPSNPAESYNPAADHFAKRLQDVHDQLRIHIKDAQEIQKRNYDKHAKQAPEFKPGDKVWLLKRNMTTDRPSPKLDVRRLGPYRIIEKVGNSNLAFKLELPTHMKIHPVFHVSLLEPHKPSTIPGRIQSPPPPILIDTEPEFVVKEILDSKLYRGVRKYLVEWQGYPPDDRTWEPIEHLTNAEDAIQDYLRRSSDLEEGSTVRNRRKRKGR
jgi:hypothetical protein